MQRLILKFVSGDGYSHYSDEVIPFVYESKEKAISDLEDMLLEALDKEQNLKVARLNHSKKYQTIVDKIKQERNAKKKEELNDELQKCLENNPGYCSYDNILFGGAEIKLDYFISNEEGNLEIVLPSIYTIDEFWAEAESNL